MNRDAIERRGNTEQSSPAALEAGTVSDADPAMPLSWSAEIPGNRPKTPQHDPGWAQRQRLQHEAYARESAALLGDPSNAALHRELGRRERETRPVHLMCTGSGGRAFHDRGGPHRSGLVIVLAERKGVILVDVRCANGERPHWAQAWTSEALPGSEFGRSALWRCAVCGRQHRSSFSTLLTAAARSINTRHPDGNAFEAIVATRRAKSREFHS